MSWKISTLDHIRLSLVLLEIRPFWDTLWWELGMIKSCGIRTYQHGTFKFIFSISWHLKQPLTILCRLNKSHFHTYVVWDFQTNIFIFINLKWLSWFNGTHFQWSTYILKFKIIRLKSMLLFACCIAGIGRTLKTCLLFRQLFLNGLMVSIDH